MTYLLIAANVGVFLSHVSLFNDPRALNAFFSDYAAIPARITAGDGLTTLVTSMFLHGGWMHLAGNILFLWVFGDNVEDEMGHAPFLLFYLTAGVIAGLFHVISAPGSAIPTVGASGAIAGVMGAYLLLFPRARVDILIILIVFIRVIPIPAWIMLALWFAFQFLAGISADPDASGVAYWAHSGGFVIGLALTMPLWLRRGGPSFWRRTQGHPPHPEARYSPSRIPKVRR